MMIPVGILASAYGLAGPALVFRDYANVPTPASSPYEWNGISVGTASDAKQAIIVVSWWAGGARDVLGVSVGAQAALLDYNSTGSSMYGFKVFRHPIPGVTSIDLDIFTTDNTLDMAAAVYTCEQPVKMVTGAYTDIAVGATTGSVTGAGVAGGAAVSQFSSRSNIFSTTWGDGFTEQFDTADAQPHSGASKNATASSVTASTTFSVATTNAVTRLGLATYKADDSPLLTAGRHMGVYTTYTFTDVPFGAADSARKILVVLSLRGTQAYSSVTIGGVTATKDLEEYKTGASDVRVVFVRAAVPTGTSGSVVVTAAGNLNSCGIIVYSYVGTLEYKRHYKSVTSSESVSVMPAEDGLIVGGSFGQNVVPAWTNIERDYDFNTAATNFYTAAASKETAVAEYNTVSATLGSYGSTCYAVYGPAKTFEWLSVSTQVFSASSYTFGNTNLGPAHASRYIIVGVSGVLPNPSSVTLGGSAMTQIVANVSSNAHASLWYLAVSSGERADIVVNVPSNGTRVCLTVWRAQGTMTVADSDSLATAVADKSLTLTTNAGDHMIALLGVSNTTTSAAWSGASELYDLTGSTFGTAAQGDSPSTGDHTIDYTGGPQYYNCLAVAAIRVT